MKMSVFSKLILRFNPIPSKIAMNCFVGIDKLILKFVQKGKRPRIINMTLKKNEDKNVYSSQLSRLIVRLH